MLNKFTVEIISPDQLVLKQETNEVTIPCYEGQMGILKDHIPIITFLRPGVIKVLNDKETTFFVEEGIVEFNNNNLLILTSTPKELSKIDKSSLKSLIEEAEQKISKESISDKEKYLLNYKIDTLKSIN